MPECHCSGAAAAAVNRTPHSDAHDTTTTEHFQPVDDVNHLVEPSTCYTISQTAQSLTHLTLHLACFHLCGQTLSQHACTAGMHQAPTTDSFAHRMPTVGMRHSTSVTSPPVYQGKGSALSMTSRRRAAGGKCGVSSTEPLCMCCNQQPGQSKKLDQNIPSNQEGCLE